MRNKNIIIGCGRLGASIANYEASLGGDVIVIDSNGESFDRLDELFSGYTIVADATDVDELEEVGIANAKQVVITTGDDNVNLLPDKFSPPLAVMLIVSAIASMADLSSPLVGSFLI